MWNSFRVLLGFSRSATRVLKVQEGFCTDLGFRVYGLGVYGPEGPWFEASRYEFI